MAQSTRAAHGRPFPGRDVRLRNQRQRIKRNHQMTPRVQSTVTPEPMTFNEWQEFLRQERAKIWAKKIGNEDLIDIERDNE